MSKKLYEQPTTKVLVVRVEGCLLSSNRFNSQNHTQYIIGGDDDDYETL